MRVGPFNATSDGDYLSYIPGEKRFAVMGRQPAGDLVSPSQLEEATEAPVAQTTTDTPPQETHVEPTIEPLSSPAPAIATSAIAREGSQEEPATEEPPLALAMSVLAALRGKLAGSVCPPHG